MTKNTRDGVSVFLSEVTIRDTRNNKIESVKLDTRWTLTKTIYYLQF